MTRQHLLDGVRSFAPQRARRQLKRARLASRQRMPGRRLLPDVLIIGGMRCGTTSLYKWLSYHPSVAPPLRKEIEFFTLEYGRGLDWYRAHFPLEIRRAAAESTGRQVVTFEATPYYLFHPHAARRAAQALPDTKVVVLLRDPVDRAYSHYRHIAQLGLETATFEQAIALESERIGRDTHRLLDEATYVSKAHRRYSYLARGLYAEQLERWFQFFPPERFLIVESEEMYRQPSSQYAKVLEFLGLPDAAGLDLRNYSRAGRHLTHAPPTMTAATLERLREYYAPHDERLAELLGRRPGWMGSSPTSPTTATSEAR